MKKNILSLAAVASLSLWMAACTNSTNEKAETDSTAKSTATSTETTSSAGNYAAMADSVERNSQQGYYLNPKTGKPYGKLTVDRSTGRISTETGEPVWRYVDNRSWWVYGGDNWDTMGHAKMQGNKLTYEDQSGNWVDYDTRWKNDDEDMIKKYKVSDDGNKQKIVTEDGDKIKTKTDEEGTMKIKVNNNKMKIDSNGMMKKQ